MRKVDIFVSLESLKYWGESHNSLKTSEINFSEEILDPVNFMAILFSISSWSEYNLLKYSVSLSNIWVTISFFVFNITPHLYVAIGNMYPVFTEGKLENIKSRILTEQGRRIYNNLRGLIGGILFS